VRADERKAIDRGAAVKATRAVLAALVVTLASAAASVSFASGTLSGECSQANARQLVAQYGLNGFQLPNPVAQLLCGPFTGPGSDAMVVAIGVAPTCWPIQRWAVFSFVGGAWKLVLDRPQFIVPPLAAVGSDIRETVPVYRPGDPRCIPTGGTRARLWHWDGARFTAGPWKQVKTGAPRAGKVKTGGFKTPSGNIVCEYFFNYVGPPGTPPRNFIRCGIHSGLKPPPPRRSCGPDLSYVSDRFSLGATGRAAADVCVGDIGPYAVERKARVLGYGKAWSGGGLTCKSAFAGLTCRNRSGRGFFVSRARWRTF
jgi:hypothetical protein